MNSRELGGGNGGDIDVHIRLVRHGKREMFSLIVPSNRVRFLRQVANAAAERRDPNPGAGRPGLSRLFPRQVAARRR